MSEAGQFNFTGISAQADITLFYLLNVIGRTDFQKIIIEGKEWEDFTLVFDDHTEDFEVKWHERPLSYREIRSIVKKELTKSLRKDDKLKIVAKKVSKSFVRDYTYIRESLPWWIAARKKNPIQNAIFKKFIDKGWKDQEIAFLFKTEIKEIKDDNYISARIMEYFAFKDPFYLGDEDLENLVSRSFRRILKEGAKGKSISKQDYLMMLKQFKDSIAKKSESFFNNPIAKKIGNINDFFVSEKAFQKINDDKYLSPISATPRLIFYITDRLEKLDYNFKSWKFFLEKILVKQNYIFIAMRLLKAKWEDNKVGDPIILDFILDNFHNLFHEFNYSEALRIIIKITKHDSQGIFGKKILDFLKKEVLVKFKVQREKTVNIQAKYSDFGDDLADGIDLLYEKSKDKKQFIEFIFEYFDMTGSGLSDETSSKIFEIIRKYLAKDINSNLKDVTFRICNQFDFIYGGKYQGYEWSGGAVGHWGSSYSINDIRVVSYVFRPLFNSMYAECKQKSWNFFKKNILDQAIIRPTKENPIFLKRALVGILIERSTNTSLNSNERFGAFKYLKNLLRMKKGIPGTSEIIFQDLEGTNLEKFRPKLIMDLIHIDARKFKSKQYPGEYPTNIFVIKLLFSLIKNDYSPAKKYFLQLVKKLNFYEMDRWYNSFDLMHQMGIADKDPVFVCDFLNIINLEDYLNSLERHDIWDKNDILTDLIKKDWEENANYVGPYIKKLLAKKDHSKQVLEFMAGIIHDLSKIEPLKTYKLIEISLQSKQVYSQSFQANSYIKQNVVWLAEELAKRKKFMLAEKIIQLNCEDPDPVTNNRPSDFNYHYQVKNGKDVHTISTVRGTVAWVLRYLSASNILKHMKFAYRKTLLLLDLEGKLAKKLGYPEPDNYVRLMALISLLELVKRRNLMNKYEPGLGDKVKTTSLDIIRCLKTQINSTKKIPKHLLINLFYVFSYIRDLNTEEAKQVVQFFLENEITEAVGLLIYFSIFRNKQFKEIAFSSKYFKGELSKICETDNLFREETAKQFLIRLSDKEAISYHDFIKVEKYWVKLFSHYNRNVFHNLYRTLAITLKWKSKYKAHLTLLKDAMLKEIKYLRELEQYVQYWGIDSKIFQILIKQNTKDFLEVFLLLLKNINESFHVFSMDSWIFLYNSIKPTNEVQKRLAKKILKRLKELYPERYNI